MNSAIFFKKLSILDFPLSEYVIVGSGPLVARGLRKANDIDIAVTAKLWQQLFDSGYYVVEERYGRNF